MCRDFARERVAAAWELVATLLPEAGLAAGPSPAEAALACVPTVPRARGLPYRFCEGAMPFGFACWTTLEDSCSFPISFACSRNSVHTGAK